MALRWAPSRFPSEGATRWALFRMQTPSRSADFFLIAWRHFHDRLLFPGTRVEALIRAGYAAASVFALGLAGVLFAFINRRQMPYGEAGSAL